MTVVKICGLTNLADGRAALAYGADLLGFNFYGPSPRYIAPVTAAGIIESLHTEFRQEFRTVGVFVNAPLDEVKQIQRECALDLVQLHGDEPVEFCQALGMSAFKALRPASAAQLRASLQRFSVLNGQVSRAPRFLLDASHAHLFGGTGESADWQLASEVAAAYPMLLAGGLTPYNVGSAIRIVKPWGVDVASGVEGLPGQKDAQKVRAFILAAKSSA